MPFDISHYRAVTYCDSNLINDTLHNVITNLRRHAESTLGPSFRVSNPVTDAGFSRPWTNRDQLRKLEKRRNEGGILFDGEEPSYHGITYVFVKSLTPIESEQEGFASHVMNNIRKNVRYRYFFKDNEQALGTIDEMITNLLVEQWATVEENILTIKSNLTVFMAERTESFEIDYCILNALRNIRKCYMRYRGARMGEHKWAWIEWYKGAEAIATSLYERYKLVMEPAGHFIMCPTSDKRKQLLDMMRSMLKERYEHIRYEVEGGVCVMGREIASP